MPFDKETATKAGKKSSRKAVPNKSNMAGREQLVNLMAGQLKKIEKELTKLTGREYLDVVVKFMPYVFPKQSQVVENFDVSKLTDEEVEALLNRIQNEQ